MGIRKVGHVLCEGDKNCYKLLVRHRWKNNIDMGVRVGVCRC
jgi:hypothetical protein